MIKLEYFRVFLCTYLSEEVDLAANSLYHAETHKKLNGTSVLCSFFWDLHIHTVSVENAKICTVKNNVEEMIVYIFFLAPKSIEFEAAFDFFQNKIEKGNHGPEGNKKSGDIL